MLAVEALLLAQCTLIFAAIAIRLSATLVGDGRQVTSYPPASQAATMAAL